MGRLGFLATWKNTAPAPAPPWSRLEPEPGMRNDGGRDA